MRNTIVTTQCFFDFSPLFISTDAPEVFHVMIPEPVPSPTPEATLAAAMAEVESFARDKIEQRAFWQFFIAESGGQRSRGMWRSVRLGGPQVVLLEVFPSIDPPKLWVPRPTGALVLEGSYVAFHDNGFEQEISRLVEHGRTDTVSGPYRHSISPIGDSCSLLITRLPLFPNTPPAQVMAHTVSRMDRDEAAAFHTKMERLLAG